MILEDGDVALRKPDPQDVAPMARLANNRKIWDNLRDVMPHPYAEQDAEDFIAHAEEGDDYIYSIIYKNDFCGVASLVPRTDVHRYSMEIGYWLGEPFWSKGIMTKVIHLLLDFAREELEMKRVFAGVFEYNQASMSLLEKCGFEKEGTLRKAIYKNGQFWDEHCYGIIF